MKNFKILLPGLMMMISFNLHAAQVGQPAPDFVLKDGSGKTHQLSDLKGKHVVLEWLNHDCPYVVKHYETGNMQRLQQEFTEKGVSWFSIISSAEGTQGYLEPKESLKVSKQKKSKATAVLLDPDGKVGRAYGSRVTPHMYVINEEGVLVYNGAIDDKPTMRHSDVEGAKNYVVAALNASMAGKPVPESATRAYGCGVKYKK
jgi:peroxiredoxin